MLLFYTNFAAPKVLNNIASSINKALSYLIDKEYVYRSELGYIVYDRFMGIWLRIKQNQEKQRSLNNSIYVQFNGFILGNLRKIFNVNARKL